SNGTLTFTNGVTNQTFLVGVSNNVVVQGNRTINLVLSHPAGGASSNGQIISALLTIQEDDQEAGSIDASFGGAGANAPVDVIVVNTNACNSRLMVGGQCTLFGGINRRHLVRLNPNGSVDNTFDTANLLNASVLSV